MRLCRVRASAYVPQLYNDEFLDLLDPPTEVGGPRKKLSIEELRKGSINSAVIGAVEICPKEVPADVKSKVEAALQKARQSS